MTAAVPAAGARGAWLTVSLALARRSLTATRRVPAAFLSLTIMPLAFLVFFSGAFEGLTDLPSYPTDRAVSWVLPFAVVQASAFAGLGAGLPTARDIQSGFFDRLLLAPGSRVAILLGDLWAAMVRSGLTVIVVVAVGFALGAELRGGVLGLAMLVVAAVGVVGMALAWTLGVTYRSTEVRSVFAIVQVGIFFPTFLSTGQVPLSEQTGWAHALARINPITNILELARQGMVGHVHWSSTWPGLLALAGSLVALWTFAVRGLGKLVP